MIQSRRYDLDWLRAIAFFVLIYFHAAIIFIPDGLPMIQNEQTSAALEWFVNISHQFRLALLFFISGVGVCFARRHKSNKDFVFERSKRLLIPLAFSLAAIVPPMVYLEKMFLGEFTGTLFEFYGALLSHGVYPKGNLSWHHMWFIAYLFLFCVLSLPVYPWLEKLKVNLRGIKLYLFVLVLFVPEVLLRPFFPGFRDLIHDWASFGHWLLIFWAGYVFAGRDQLLDIAEDLLPASMILVFGVTMLIILLFGRIEFVPDFSDPWIVPRFMLFSVLRMLMVWSAILFLVGLAAKFLRFNHPVLAYINEAVYPLFILHLTTITLLGYWLVDTEYSIFSKYMMITTGTLVSNLACYHFLIRPFNFVRVLFGVKSIATPRNE